MSLKILHTSDWHLGHQLYNYSRLDEHRHFIALLADMVREHRPDLLIIAGDIFDQQSPSLGAQQLWADALLTLLDAAPKMEIVAIAGNHDSGSRLAVQAPLMRDRIHIVGRDPELVHLGDSSSPSAVIAAIPYLPDFAFKRYFEQLNKAQTAASIDEKEEDPDEQLRREEEQDGKEDEKEGCEFQISDFYAMMAAKARTLAKAEKTPLIAVSHVAVSGADTDAHPLRDFNFFPAPALTGGFDYHALGHIHFPQSFCGGKIRYSGSPIPLSFDEPYTHSVSLLEFNNEAEGVPTLTILPVEPLRGVLTLPKEGKAIRPEEVQELIDSVPTDREIYLRVRVEAIGNVPESVNAALRKAFRDTKVRFCLTQGVLPPLPEEQPEEERPSRPVSIDEIRGMDPLVVADLHFRRKYSRPLPDDLRQVLDEILTNN